MSNEKKNPKKKDTVKDTAFIAAVISQTFFNFIIANKKNSFLTYHFIVDLSVSFFKECEKHKYIIGNDPLKDREAIVNWTKDTLNEHPDFQDMPTKEKEDERK